MPKAAKVCTVLKSAEVLMKLLTPELRAQLPPLYSQEKNDDPIVHVKFFCPWSNWTWFATEGRQEDDEFLFFGYVIGLA
jgi:Protein of unknown function (DUF2958)